MRQDKITAITVACVIGLFLSWRGLESFGEDGLTFSEWAMAIGVAVVFAAAAGRVGYMLMRRYNPGDDDE